MDDLDPEKLWEDKGADYIAPYDEVLERVARWIESDLQELWNCNTTLKHPWFLARNAGLRAWSEHEAELRLNPFYREKYTLADYLELNLIERMQRHGDMEVKDSIWADFTSSQTQTEGISFWGRIVEKAKLKPSQHQLVHRLFCCYWDRFFVPFEFWTYPAMEACLTEILMEKHAIADSVRVGNLRQLVKRLKLQKSSHIIVRQFVGEQLAPFDNEAAAAAGWPKDDLIEYVEKARRNVSL
jgi:hypothetical protein